MPERVRLFVASATHNYGPVIRNFVYVLALILAIHGAGYLARTEKLGQSQNFGLYAGVFLTVFAALMATIVTITTL